MRLLKQKIVKAAAFKRLHHRGQRTIPVSQSKSNALSAPCLKKRKRSKEMIITPEATRCTKNIVKNFGRAICSFANSTLATPYLQPLLQKHNISLSIFSAYVLKMKKNIDGLFRFRDLIMPQDGDTEELETAKRVFQLISEVFIKCFSVNWIIHGKIQHKESHLKCRFKMLRRIKSPELFTYLKRKAV